MMTSLFRLGLWLWFCLSEEQTYMIFVVLFHAKIDCEQFLFGQSRLSSAGLERANSRERGKRECEASESQGEAGEKAGKWAVGL